MQNKRWSITSEKFLAHDQVSHLVEYLLKERDLAIARDNDPQAIKAYYMVRTLLESGLRVFEFCDLINSDLCGQKLSVRRGKGNKPRTVLLTKATSNLLKEWLIVKERLGFSLDASEPLFPSRYKRHYTTRAVQKIIKTVFGQAGLQNHLSVHSLRHTYCSLLLATGKVSLATVKENMGHHSIAVTNLYAHSCSNLDEIELYQAPSSEKEDKSELQSKPHTKKPNSFVKTFLRKTNFNPGEVK